MQALHTFILPELLPLLAWCLVIVLSFVLIWSIYQNRKLHHQQRTKNPDEEKSNISKTPDTTKLPSEEDSKKDDEKLNITETSDTTLPEEDTKNDEETENNISKTPDSATKLASEEDSKKVDDPISSLIPKLHSTAEIACKQLELKNVNCVQALAFKGILLSNQSNEMLQLRSLVVTVDEHVAISLLPLAIQTEIIKFSNRKQELIYTTSIKSFGFPITNNHQSPLTIGEFTLETMDVDQDSSSAKEAYVSTFKEYKLPLAKCELQLNSLKLNKDAIQELKQIQHLISAQGIFSPRVQMQCNNFFHKYGTHINVGTMIIGGIYWQKCYSSGFTASESGSTTELQHSVITSKALSTFTNLNGKLDCDKLDLILNSENGEFPLESYLENATVGGSSEPNMTIADWGEQLVRKPDTWTIIDREQMKFIPIWDILHRTVELGDSLQLNIALSHSSKAFIKSSDMLNTVLNFFECLGMKLYYPQFLKQIDSLMIREDTLNKSYCDSLKQLPWLVLQKIMSFDTTSVIDLMHNTDSIEELYLGDDDIESNDEESNADPESTHYNPKKIHPIDVILVLFHCSNDALRQDLFVRLSTCQLAIPLIFKDPVVNKLVFPLWSLSSIVKTWRTKDGKDIDEYIVDYKMPIVSFIRIGCHTISKSKLLNDIISNTHHDHFFHRDCNGGSNMRFLANGLIDMCWYLPGGKEDILFPDAVAFLNLHGDATEEEFQTQANFLSKISSLTFILIPEKLGEKGISIVKTFSEAVLVSSAASIKSSSFIEIGSKRQRVISLKQINADDTRRLLRGQVLKKCFDELPPSGRSVRREIKTFIKAAGNINGILVDEECKTLSEARNLAVEWVNGIGDLNTFKAKALPLQGETMWHKWAENDKEEHRQRNRPGTEGIETYSEKIGVIKDSIRQHMIQHIQLNIHPSMQSFLDCFQKKDDVLFSYYIKYMKINLNKMSKNSLALLHGQYHTTKDKLKKAKSSKKEKNEKGTIEKLTSELAELNKEIINISFGIEHLLREVAQMYESDPKQNENLPIAAAKLLIDGHPLEVMDGDASHVPIAWLKAVLNNVVNLLHDPYIYVLSVLGLQSTGKSTLLNSVFGLQFNASAGRCTRGAYMQLVPVSEEIRMTNQNEIRLNCDYILVVDTEGLRAPELDFSQTQRHDNELATFVIGLANKTIVNIYGEVAGDLDDILQTAVHAFIRMKEVDIKPSCMFVHQNAGTNAKAVVGQDRFVQKLDEMTQYAAAEENSKSCYESFSDVIDFDYERDIHHFQCLWLGDPPMAPVNLGYSNSAQRLKANLIAQIRTTNCSRISSFCQTLEALWKALLHENFVFSFRNCLEINAYNSLEAQYTQWEWRLRSDVKRWTAKIENKIHGLFAIDSGDALDEATVATFTAEAVGELTTTIGDTLSELIIEFDKYFEDSNQKEVIIKWNSDFKLRLQSEANGMERRAISTCMQLCEGKQKFEAVVKDEKKYKQHMFDEIKKIATRLRNEATQLTKQELHDLFEKSWKRIMNSLTEVQPVQSMAQVKRDVQENLLKFVALGDQQTVRTAIPKLRGQTTLKLIVIPEEHVIVTESWKDSFGKLLRKAVGLKDHNKQTAKQITEKVLESASTFLTPMSTKMYTTSLTTDMLKIMKDVLLEQENLHPDFTFTSTYRIDLYVTACNYATKQFEKMVEELNRKHDPKVYLECTLKDAFHKMFIDEYENIAHELKITSSFAAQLSKCIKHATVNELRIKVEDAAKSNQRIFQTKKVLKAKILLDLAEEVQTENHGKINFEGYKLYFTNSKQCFQSWTTKYVKQFCDEKGDSKFTTIQNLAINIVKAKIEFVNSKIDDIAVKFKDMHKSSKDWLNEFCKDKGVVEMFGDVFMTSVTDLLDVHDINIESFTVTLKAELDEPTDLLIQEFENFSYQILDHVSEEFLNSVLGCLHQCPFCEEICDHTVTGHTTGLKKVEHQVDQHRPDCLAGYRSASTDIMSISICTTLVGGKDIHTRFRNKDTKYEWQNYSSYKEIYPDWDIPFSIDKDVSPYWKWFVGKYMKQIASTHGAKPGDVPESWCKMEWKTVKEQVEIVPNKKLIS